MEDIKYLIINTLINYFYCTLNRVIKLYLVFSPLYIKTSARLLHSYGISGKSIADTSATYKHIVGINT